MRLHYEAWGEGPAFLFLHGFLGSGDNWRTIARSLGLPARYYLIDLRNHGRSPHAPEHTYPAMMADIVALLDSEGLPEAVILGHSMGGRVGMLTAMHHPTRVRGLIVVDISPAAHPPAHLPLLEALRQVNLHVARREDVDAQLAQAIPEPGIRQFLLKSLVRDEQGHFHWRWNLPVLTRDYPKMTGPIEGPPYPGPALFLQGERSPFLTQAHLPLIQRLFPKARLQTIPGAGHWIHVDNPTAVRDAIIAFWNDLFPVSENP